MVKSAQIELSNKPFGTYVVSSCRTTDFPAGLSGELQHNVLSDRYREFNAARDAIIDYMGKMYRMNRKNVSVLESTEPAITI